MTVHYCQHNHRSPLATAAAILLLALSGCTTLQQNPDVPVVDSSVIDSSAETAAPPEVAAAKPKPPLKPFEPETLFDLLVADFAGANQQYGLQLNRYHKQAFATRDPGVAAAATWLAIQLNAAQQALELSQLWVDLAPENSEANRIAGYYLAYSGQLAKALPHALQALRSDDKEASYAIGRQLSQAKPEQRQQLQRTLRRLIAANGKFHDLANNSQVALLDARLLLQQEEFSAAIERARGIQAPETERDSALLLIAQAVFEQDGLEANLANLEQSVALYPDSKRLRLQLAKQWAEKDVERSRAELVKLVEQFPDDKRLVYALAMFNMNKADYAEAQPLLESLLDSADFQDNAHYQLGRIHELQERPDRAIEHYSQVKAGDNYDNAVTGQIHLLAANNRDAELNELIDNLLALNPNESAGIYQQIAAILAGNKHNEQALTLLNTALEKHPDDGGLLYERSMLYELGGDSAKSHRDLRTIIAMEPDSANALNALGYSLSNSEDPADYTEAHQLVSKALKLDPENPAILDSMGWALFRLQRLDEALPYLRKAFELFPDPEVAAHLGEVLWQMGERTEALDIWEKSLADNKDKDSSKHVVETMERLGATRVGPEPESTLMASFRFYSIAVLLATLTACSTLPPQHNQPVTDWQRHQQQLQSLKQWQLNGKLAFRSPAESGSASLRWQQQEHQYQMRLSGTFGIGTTYIEGNQQQVVLRKGDEQLIAASSQQLTYDLLGVPLSVEDLTYWVRGIPAPTTPVTSQSHDPQGLLSQLEQGGWQLTFSRYRQSGNWLLPGKIDGTKGELSFKLVVKGWGFE